MHTVSWGWLFDVGGGGNRTGRIGGLLQCAGATGAVRSTFVGLGGLGWFVDAAQVAEPGGPSPLLGSIHRFFYIVDHCALF